MIFILNGPNLNMKRSASLYGDESLENICQRCLACAPHIDFRQTNHEGVLVDWIQEIHMNAHASGLILNAGALTHTSVALYDVLEILVIPIIEVHLSIPQKRESFRHVSYVTPHASGVICGFKGDGYIMAIEAIKKMI